ncbi:Spy/CpxP family protein refolding chaperone [Planctomyces sp. SH-PL14]|uniref:Spy/CpxP family protein refolding chaperone n=1 Tax=Planctomyces sp. SH-PL14 TaxID=1632864 RepID=UPI00078D3C27|nr:hypothetical protein [Planctomyces sp. SH-PL14]AMV20902.1 LTXXQ motif protein [Planctomyces sp. SH-PL14]
MKLHRLVLCAALLFASPVLAQPGGGGGGGRGGFRGMGGGGGGVAGLVGMEAVQKELSITDEQKAALGKIQEEMRASFQGFDFQALRDLSEEERNKKMEEFRKKGQESAKKVEGQVKELLNEEQWARLGELRIQREGVSALSREEVAKDLALTDEQKEKIAKLSESLRPQFGRGGPGGGGGGGERPNFEEMRAQREKTEGEVMAVLTDDQKAKLEKMKGEKFEFPRPMFGGGQGGGQGGRGRRPAGDSN